MRTSPCEWPVDYSACPQPAAYAALGDGEGVDGRLVWETMATDFLWRWTGLGVCPVTVRPCREDCSAAEFGGPLFSGTGLGGGFLWNPAPVRGAWTNLGCGLCGDRCSCSHVSSIRLPGPVAEITRVQVGAEVLVEDVDYRLDGNRLIRLNASWPTCNDLYGALGDEDVWEVEYLHGVAVPVGGQIAAGILAVEFWKAACNDGSCQLPRRIQTMTRQGVTIGMLDTFDDIDTGHTGIWLVDSWVTSVTKPRTASRVYSPDLPHTMGR